MKSIAQGCLGAIILGLIAIVVLKLVFGDMFELILLPLLVFGVIILLAILSTASDAINGSLKAGKWLGLGAIVGNVLNNKINADAAVKSGKTFKKRQVKTKSSLVNGIAEFISPSTEDSDDSKVSEADHQELSEVDYKEFQEFQEFLKWKKSKNK